jgi:predicted nucleic acid-binding protein
MEALTFPHIPSDHLPSLKILLEHSPGLSPFVPGLQRLRLIIDASFLLGDLIWLVKKRKEPSARTAFKEVLVSGTILAVAPVALRQEVCEKIPLIAVRENISEVQLRKEWDSYQPFQHYVAVDPRESSIAVGAKSVRDPNDLPYVYLYDSTDATAVLSLDNDIAAMGTPTVGFDVIIHLRDYARSKTVEVSFLVCGATIGTASLHGAMELLAALERGLSQLPDWAKLLLVVGGLVAVLHPGIRSAIHDFLIKVWQQLKPLLDTVEPAITQLVQALNTEKEMAIQS